MLISSFQFINGTIITPLLYFYPDPGLEFTELHRFVQFIPLKCFTSFVQSEVNARREGDKNPHPGVVAETMKLVANSSCVYQMMDRGRHRLTSYLKDEKALTAISNKFFKRLNYLNDNLFKLESLKSGVDHKELFSLVFFFILQFAKLRMLEF